jgi:hypothetical protein
LSVLYDSDIYSTPDNFAGCLVMKMADDSLCDLCSGEQTAAMSGTSVKPDCETHVNRMNSRFVRD